MAEYVVLGINAKTGEYRRNTSVPGSPLEHHKVRGASAFDAMKKVFPGATVAYRRYRRWYYHANGACINPLTVYVARLRSSVKHLRLP